MATAEVVEMRPTEPLALVRLALEKGADPGKLGRLMDLAERWAMAQARAKYAAAVAGFQSECPQVPKTRAVLQKGGGERYKFAGLEDVMKVCQPLLAKHGIAVSFYQPAAPVTTAGAAAEVETVCEVRVGSHAEEYSFLSPRPDWEKLAASMYLTVPQAFGLTLSYYKRYAFCAVLNVTVCGEDSDAAADDVGLQQGLSEEQVRVLTSQLRLKDIDVGEFLRLANVNSLDEITQAQLPKALAWVDAYGPRKGGAA